MRISELRKKLDELESKWTLLDTEVMGKFGEQEVYVPVFSPIEEGLCSCFQYRGYSRDLKVQWEETGLGLVIDA